MAKPLFPRKGGPRSGSPFAPQPAARPTLAAGPAPFQPPPPLQALGDLIASGRADPAVLEPLLSQLEAAQCLDQAWLLLRRAPLDPVVWAPWQGRLKALLARDRDRRLAVWQTDPDRATLRLEFQLGDPACAPSPAALVQVLAGILLEAGLPLAVSLEKSLRPAIHLGHPLPPMVAGWSEWADAALVRAPGLPEPELPARLNAHAPAGLRILQVQAVPNHASPVPELCRRGRWRWACPADRLDQDRARLDRFLASERFEIEKHGKIDGQKGAKRVDIRPLLEDCRWEGPEFHFATAIGPGAATNPRRLLEGILGREVPPGELARVGVELAEDPRLAQGDKYQPKLRNMFEDAVLLESGGNIRIVDEDDDEPLVLG
jgi:hypothetical protein